MHIRRLAPEDALVYREFRLRGLREHPAAFTSSHEEEIVQPLATTGRRLAADSETRMLGAFVGATLAGAVGLAGETRLKNRHKATVVAMYVQPEFARRGIGRALVERLIVEARAMGIEQLVLTVTASNPGARKLYANAGFETFGFEPRAIKVHSAYHAKEYMLLPLVAT